MSFLDRSGVRHWTGLEGLALVLGRARATCLDEPLPLSSIRLSRMEEEVIPVLYVEDAARAVGWYERLGFRKQWEHQFEPGFPLFVSVARGRVRLYLSEHTGDARPDTLVQRQGHRRSFGGVRDPRR